jgi:hypothetical protein
MFKDLVKVELHLSESVHQLSELNYALWLEHQDLLKQIHLIREELSHEKSCRKLAEEELERQTEFIRVLQSSRKLVCPVSQSFT